MAILNSLPDIFAILFSHGPVLTYLILFILMFAEGPIVAYLASFAASLGYLNIWIIFGLFILGNQGPDVILYYIGRSLKKKSIEKLLSYIGLHKKRVTWLEKNVKKHSIKTLFSFKLIPQLPIPGLILCGFLKLPFKKFFWATLIMNIAFAIAFTALGFYSGIAIASFLKYLKLVEYLAPIAIVLTILLYFLIKLVHSKQSNRFNKKNG